MKNYVFLAQKQGYEREKEFIWFCCEDYTLEEARAEFKKVKGETEKNGDIYPYTAYEYQGELYYKVAYQGVFDEDDMPKYKPHTTTMNLPGSLYQYQ